MTKYIALPVLYIGKFVLFMEGAMASVMVTYSQVQKFYEEAQVKGVGILVEHPESDQLLIVKEKETKISLGKLAGMKSCILETAEKGESINATFIRAMKEEAPGIDYMVVREQGYYQITSGVWALVFVVQALSDKLPFFHDYSDVHDPKWITPRDAIQAVCLRQGVREIIFDYIRGRERVTCMECEKPFLSSS